MFEVLSGLAYEDADGQWWGFLSWQSEEPIVLAQPSYTVYRKSGDPDSVNPFEQVGVMATAQTRATIAALVRRGEALGDDAMALEETLDQLFEMLMPDPSIPLEAKIAVVIREAEQSPEVYRRLWLTARRHLSLLLCMGQAMAVPIPSAGPSTFEVRERLSSGDDGAVAGTATVDPTSPVVLPAPTDLFEVVEASPKGHLQARLRWSTPDALKDFAALHHGFHLYRMLGGFAESQGFDVTPPGAGALTGLAAANPAFVRRVSENPVLPALNLTPAQATDTNDTETFFIIDDNNRFREGVPFINGARYYYFVTPADLLGQEGAVSDGLEVTICDRIPPPAPRRVRVDNTYTYDGAITADVRRLNVSWEPVPEEGPLRITGYEVFRWQDPTGPSLPEPNSNLVARSGFLPFVLSPDPRQSWEDPGPYPSPAEGIRFWYTVRAYESSACGTNDSPHSAPAPGVLRDREGPPAPIGVIGFYCRTPIVSNSSVYADTDMDDEVDVDIEYSCTRTNDQVLWAQFSYGLPEASSNISPRLYFKDSFDNSVEWRAEADWTVLPNGQQVSLLSYCRVGTTDGAVSYWAPAPPVVLADIAKFYYYDFRAGLVEGRTSFGDDDLEFTQCRFHFTRPLGDETPDAVPEPLEVTLTLTEGTEEWRLYRRVDSGPLTLIAQAFESYDDLVPPLVTVADENLPANAALVCYYVQYADENGNAGPLTRVGCIQTTTLLDLPAPVLKPILSTGDDSNRVADLTWFAPPDSFDRFELWLQVQGSNNGTTLTGQDLTPADTNDVLDADGLWHVFETGRIGGNFDPGPSYDTEVELGDGRALRAKMRGLTQTGRPGPFSNMRSFSWRTPGPLPPDQVPWPARSMPYVEADAIEGLVADAIEFETGKTFLCLRIGDYEAFVASPSASYSATTGERIGLPVVLPQAPVNEIDLLYHDRQQETVFPCAVYRVQVPNPLYPTVSSNVVQVTPLMEFDRIFSVNQLPSDWAIVTIWSALIDIHPDEPGSDQHGIYILDTQPASSGARYRYLIVRFRENGEIDKVITTNSVTAP